ncbi:MAG: pyridoxal phosphate-dependent decarboxylase family protein [Desulfobulbus sp.]|jgi:glutamate/tyrosine decarboxylase-like PLP-dependent enzyme
MEPEQIFSRLAQLASQYRHEQSQGAYVAYLEPGELQQRLDLTRKQAPGDWEELFHWVETYLRYAVKTGHPGYLNRMWAGANLPSIIGEMVSALTNTSACTFETAPVSTLMEKYMIKTMLNLVGFAQGVGQMTTGSSNANMIAMLAARNHHAQTVKQQGLFGQKELFAFVNEEAHYSLDRAANILGLGSDHLIKVPADGHGCMDTQALEDTLQRIVQAGGQPFFVTATAGSTVRGGFDRLQPLLQLRTRFPFWLHVDGAWGGPVIFSETLRTRYLPLLEQADSFTMDFHKMPGTALMCNVLLMRGNSSVLRRALSAGDESYIFREGSEGEIRDLGTLSLQCGRRVDSLKWFLDWKFYGQEGLARRVEGYLALCEYAEAQIKQQVELEMVAPRESFNVCFRHRAPQNIDPALLNTRIREKMQQQGRYLVGTGFVNGQLALRLLITNTQVGKADIDEFLATVVRTGQEVLAT